MMKMYVIETSKMQEICQQKTGIAEQQLCLKLFSEVHGQIQMKEHDFQSIWKIITQDHPRRYISKKVHDQKKQGYYLCIEDTKTLIELRNRLTKIEMEEVLEKLRKEDRHVYRNDYLYYLDAMKRAMLEGIQAAIKEDYGLVFYYD